VPNYKKLIMLDSETLDIVTNQAGKNHSDFIRKSINFYHLNKDADFSTKEPEVKELTNLELEL